MFVPQLVSENCPDLCLRSVRTVLLWICPFWSVLVDNFGSSGSRDWECLSRGSCDLLKETHLFHSSLRKSALATLTDKAGKIYILYHTDVTGGLQTTRNTQKTSAFNSNSIEQSCALLCSAFSKTASPTDVNRIAQVLQGPPALAQLLKSGRRGKICKTTYTA